MSRLDGSPRSGSNRTGSASRRPRPTIPRRQKMLIGLELMTGATATAGGLLLAAAPDGSLLQADLAALDGSPFTDWRLPGILLAGLVGGGFLCASTWEWQGGPHARELSMLAGLGLISFEAAELTWLGLQPLEAVFAMVGAAVVGLAVPTRQPSEVFEPGHEEPARTS